MGTIKISLEGVNKFVRGSNKKNRYIKIGTLKWVRHRYIKMGTLKWVQ